MGGVRIAVCGVVACLALPAAEAAAAFPAAAGKSHFFQGAGPGFDRWTMQGGGCGQHYKPRYFRMRMYPPYSNACVRYGYPRALGYTDVQAIYKDHRGRPITPHFVLKDATGHRLYVRWGCRNGTCPQFAADIGSPRWRQLVIDRIRRWPGRYRGIFLDDVNWHLNVSNGNAQVVRPIDRRTGRPMTQRNWRRYMANFMEEIRAAFPAKERMINSVWWRHASDLDDPDVRRGVQAATHFEIERGTADVFGGRSLDALLSYIDRLHGMGLGVNLDSYQTSRARAEFEIATYFLVSAGKDMYATGYRACPEATGQPGCELPWWGAYEIDLGPPTGERTLRPDGVFQRAFERGLVLLNRPGAPTRTIFLDGFRRNLDGVPVTAVTLAGGQAAVLRPLL